MNYTCIGAIAFSIMVGAGVADHLWNNPERVDFEPDWTKRTYAFVLPQTQLGCIDYHAVADEVFTRWHFIQPVRILKREGDHLTFNDPFFDGEGGECNLKQSSVPNVVWIEVE